MIIPIFQGIESYEHQDTLDSALSLFEKPPAFAVSASFHSMKNRRLTSKFVADLSNKYQVVLESGMYTSELSFDEAMDAQSEYFQMISECPEAIYAIQMDHDAIPLELRRTDTSARFIPVLDLDTVESDPSPILEELLLEWQQIALRNTEDLRIAPVLRRHRDRLSISLGEPDLVSAAKHGFSASMFNSWIAPGRFGELIFWDGVRLRRYSSDRREKAFRKYEAAIERTGVDVSLVAEWDSKEMIRLAAHAYLSLSAALSSSTGSYLLSDTESSNLEPGYAGSKTVSTNNEPPSLKPSRAPIPLPVLESAAVSSLEDDGSGTMVMRTRMMSRPVNAALRQCNTCFISGQCPAYEADATCAFNMPLEIRTDDQVKALLHSMVELQATRVAFARFAEEVNGGMPDPVVGQEMDRLIRMTDKVRKSDERRERLTVSVEAETKGDSPIGGGVLSKIFGQKMAVQPPSPDTIIGSIIEQ